MIDYQESEWRKYKRDFLAYNQCTADEFEAAYVSFVNSKPNDKAYRLFARKYSITVDPEPNIPEHLRTVLSVCISSMKVMAKTFEESQAAIEDLISGIHD